MVARRPGRRRPTADATERIDRAARILIRRLRSDPDGWIGLAAILSALVREEGEGSARRMLDDAVRVVEIEQGLACPPPDPATLALIFQLRRLEAPRRMARREENGHLIGEDVEEFER